MLRPRQKLGKYTIQRRIAQGGFADVYRAYDTIEGVNVALKIPQPEILVHRTLDDFLREVRLTAKLDHPNILHIKNADHIDRHFVIVYPLGEGTLSDKINNRLPFEMAIDYAGQILGAVSFAHRKRVLHCDIKPDNLILFPGNVLKLAEGDIVVLFTDGVPEARNRESSLYGYDAARDLIAERGYDPHYGARPLKRTIQRMLEDPLAMLM